jgi:hypothetical protein
MAAVGSLQADEEAAAAAIAHLKRLGTCTSPQEKKLLFLLRLRVAVAWHNLLVPALLLLLLALLPAHQRCNAG